MVEALAARGIMAFSTLRGVQAGLEEGEVADAQQLLAFPVMQPIPLVVGALKAVREALDFGRAQMLHALLLEQVAVALGL